MQRYQDNNGLGSLNIKKGKICIISWKIIQIDNSYHQITKNCGTIKYLGASLENEIFLDYAKIKNTLTEKMWKLMHLARSYKYPFRIEPLNKLNINLLFKRYWYYYTVSVKGDSETPIRYSKFYDILNKAM